jgi:nucleoside-diphosphate-sugar epimerase
MNKRATVIGAKGFVGAALLKRLETAGWQCWAPERFQPWPCNDRSLGVVFYCAGLTADYLARPFDTIDAHVNTLSQILQSQHFERLIYLSSTRLYDSLGHEELVRESDAILVHPENPRHLYDISKLAGEALCYAVGNGRTRIARLACVYRDENDPDGFLGGLLGKVKACSRGEKIRIDSSPHFLRDYVHLDDVIDALEMMAISGNHFIYNIASGVNWCNLDLARLISLHTDRLIEFDRDDRPHSVSFVDPTRVRDELGVYLRPPDEALHKWFKCIENL